MAWHKNHCDIMVQHSFEASTSKLGETRRSGTSRSFRFKHGIIQAGGLGTRLRPITYEIPKPLLPVKRKPIIQYLVELFRQSGVEKVFVLASTQDEELFSKWKADYGNEDVELVLEENRLGTWGGILHYLKHELQDTFLVSNGDELKEIELLQLLDFHKSKNALATIASIEVPNARDYGVIRSDDEGKIAEFLYKPENPPTNSIMAGLYVAEPALLHIPVQGDIVSFEEHILPQLQQRKRLYEYKCNGRWYDCGTFERYEKAIFEW